MSLVTVRTRDLARPLRDALKALGNRRQTVMLWPDTTDAVRIYGTWWDSGSRYQWLELDLAAPGRAIRHVKAPTAPPPFAPAENVTFTPTAGRVLIRVGVSSGKPAYPHIYSAAPLRDLLDPAAPDPTA